MSRRNRDACYSGAAGRIAPGAAARLGAGFMLQPKFDGIFARLRFDERGELAHVFTRAGNVLPRHLMADFASVWWLPDSVLVAEVECWTESANATAARRGFRLAHVFDVEQLEGRDLSREPYGQRRDALQRATVRLEMTDADRMHVDGRGNAHDKAGKFAKVVPHGWRRLPVVPQVAPVLFDQAWTEWVDGGKLGPVEGLVAVSLAAPIGRRGSKLKCKRSDALDCRVVQMGGGLAVVAHAGRDFIVSARGAKWRDVRPGVVVSIKHEGRYSSGTPKFARLDRVRPDLTGQQTGAVAGALATCGRGAV